MVSAKLIKRSSRTEEVAMKLTAQQSDRAAGVLLGTAAGDALGAGYEFTYPKARDRKSVV